MARGHHRFGLKAEVSVWQSIESQATLTTPIFNAGATYGYLLRDFIETSLTLGPSVLLVDTVLDPAGSVGVFFEFRPAGFRWQLADFELGFDPITFSITAPVLGAIPLVRVQFRSILSIKLWR